jgi:hypothetical protein
MSPEIVVNGQEITGCTLDIVVAMPSWPCSLLRTSPVPNGRPTDGDDFLCSADRLAVVCHLGHISWRGEAVLARTGNSAYLVDSLCIESGPG